LKLHSLVIKSYKGIKIKRIELNGESTFIKGGNGGGKTKILECLCLAIEMALYKSKTLNDYNWPYFNPHEILRKDTRVEIEIELSKEEIRRYKEIGKIWKNINKINNGDGDIWKKEIGELNLNKTKKRFFILFQGGYINNVKTCNNVFRYTKGNHLINQMRTNYFIETLEGMGYKKFERNGVPQLLKIDSYEEMDNIKDRKRNIEIRKWIEGKEERIEELNKVLRESIGESINIKGIDRWGNILINKGNETFPIEDLSYGERRILNILYKIIKDEIKDSLIIIDEIGLGLDTKRLKSFLSILKTLNNNQIIYSSNREEL